MSNVTLTDYSLTGPNAARAVELGLAEADWYTSPVPRDVMRQLLERRNGPAIRDTVLWFALLFVSGYAGYALWGTWWAIIPFLCYGVVYASSSDSRWHESSHGTAFKTDWLNNALYEIASFMVLRESVPWRWSHARHHSDTIIVGRDPEIVVPRPPDLKALLLSFFNLNTLPKYFYHVLLHSVGRMTAAEQTYIPESEYARVFLRARLYLLIYASVIGLAFYFGSVLPLMYVGLPNLYGAWLVPVYGFTQHAGLAENVLDHRLNCRTVYMNALNRYLYWNMNYHLEHHMFPLVPYHALPRLHAAIKTDTPLPYNSIMSAYREIVPTVFRQVKDPGYFIKRQLPEKALPIEELGRKHFVANPEQVGDGEWIEVCSTKDIGEQEVVRFDLGNRTFAIYRTSGDHLYATDGMCTHGNTHLATGLLMDNVIECPKHNGRFDVTDGSPRRMPVCVALRTYPVRSTNGKVELNAGTPGGCGAVKHRTYEFKVVSNDNVATFIKELVLEPLTEDSIVRFTPGDYMQLDIPAYETISLRDLVIGSRYKPVWQARHVFDHSASNAAPTRRNYSIASNGATERFLRFNVRIATPPPGQDCPAGSGSAYIFGLKPGDRVTAIGPFGDFHVKPASNREMLYVGGGAGMAPLRAHLSHLLESEQTSRRIQFWYGARSRQELFYQDYFERLESHFANFRFRVALSEPLPEDRWSSYTGFIHEVVLQEHLGRHENPRDIEYYLCGPPAMIKATLSMLDTLGVDRSMIAFDEF